MKVGLASDQMLKLYSSQVVRDLKDIKVLTHDVHGNPLQQVAGKVAIKIVGKWVNLLRSKNTTGMPNPDVTADEHEDGAAFNPTAWTLTLGAEPFMAKYLSVTECEDIAGSIYHEWRHAEQYFLMAYYLAVANPHMSSQDISARLNGMELDAVRVAWGEARIPNKLLYDFGKAMFQGEFPGWDAQVEQMYKFHKKDFAQWLSRCERVVATCAVERETKYLGVVSDEIKAYNQARPTGMPKPDKVWDDAAWAFGLAKFLTELKNAFTSRGSQSNEFYKAYHMYLGAKKLFALMRWKQAYTDYLLTTVEDDAITLETHLRQWCTKAGLTIDRGGVRGIPDPKLWTVVPPPVPPKPPKFGVPI